MNQVALQSLNRSPSSRPHLQSHAALWPRISSTILERYCRNSPEECLGENFGGGFPHLPDFVAVTSRGITKLPNPYLIISTSATSSHRSETSATASANPKKKIALRFTLNTMQKSQTYPIAVLIPFT